ncbi:MAG: transposase [Methylococcales bacterium]|nr:transposase [Methylococcales bacterium]
MDRKIWSIEEKLSIVLEMLKGEMPITEICLRQGVAASQAYRWRDMFLEGGKRTLTDGRDKSKHNPIIKENRRLKELVGSLSLIIDAQKKFVRY